jgi:hypothetical protein
VCESDPTVPIDRKIEPAGKGLPGFRPAFVTHWKNAMLCVLPGRTFYLLLYCTVNVNVAVLLRLGGGSHGDRACPCRSRRTCPGAASTARGVASASATDHCRRYPGNQQNRQQRTAATEVAPFPPLAHQSTQPKENQGKKRLSVSGTAAVGLMGFTNRRRGHACRQGQGRGGRGSPARCYRCR